MKMNCRLLSILALALAVATQAAAQTAVSVNVGARGANIGALTATEVAGVVPRANWNDFSTGNNFEPTVPPPAVLLKDSNGAVVPGMNVTFGGLLALQVGYNYGPDGIHDPDLKLMSGLVRGGFGSNLGLSLNVNNIPYATYDLVLYADTFGSLVTEYVVNGSTYYGLDSAPGNFITTGFDFSEFTTTSLAAANAEAAAPSDLHNYIRINGLSGNLALTAFTANGAGGEEAIQGFQIINAVIPEPSTMALAGLGVAAMAVRRRRGK